MRFNESSVSTAREALIYICWSHQIVPNLAEYHTTLLSMELTEKIILRVPIDKLNDLPNLESLKLVPSNNEKGFMYLQLDSYVNNWLSSLPESEKP